MKAAHRCPLTLGFLAFVLFCAGTFSARAANYGAKADPSLELFTNSFIRHLRVEIGDAEMNILRQPVARNRTGGPRPAVLCTVREGDAVWTNAGRRANPVRAPGEFRRGVV